MKLNQTVKLSCLASAIFAGAVAGCARQAEPPADPSPLVIDEAMQRRDWDRSVAYYGNGDTVGSPNRAPLKAQDTGVPILNGLMQPLAFVGNAFYLPVSYIFAPPGTETTYHGVQFEPTYTAVPPLPPSDAEPVSEPFLVGPANATADDAPTGDLGTGEPAADPRGTVGAPDRRLHRAG